MTASKQYYLFGYPIAHSASPAFHNFILNSLGTRDKYTNSPAASISNDMLNKIKADEFGGASVTMPIKVAVIKHLDKLTDAAKAIGACNTVVVERGDAGQKLFVGTNTDYLGVRNSILRSLCNDIIPTTPRFSDHSAGLVIGGGGTCRAAIYALTEMNLSPIYLVNRDPQETEAVISQYSNIKLVPIQSVSEASSVANVVVAVGCIPAIPPATEAEENVYKIVDLILSSNYASSKLTTSNESLPASRVFLDMCYKPRVTPLLKMATSKGWIPVQGIEAMLEQGLSQARMWQRGSTSAGNQTLDIQIENESREFIRKMEDIVVKKGEEPLPLE